jgi:hypothetical protein
MVRTASLARSLRPLEVATGQGARSTEPEEGEGLKLIPDRLMTELTAYRTLAWRHALSEHWDVASWRRCARSASKIRDGFAAISPIFTGAIRVDFI